MLRKCNKTVLKGRSCRKQKNKKNPTGVKKTKQKKPTAASTVKLHFAELQSLNYSLTDIYQLLLILLEVPNQT